MLFALTVYAEPSDITMDILKNASVAEGKEYLNQRDDIIKKVSIGKVGEELLIELKDAATDESLSWQTRLMANICVERVEKSAELNELINYKWRTHPEYKKDWDHLHGGPLADLAPIIVREFKKKKMWFYYLEKIWKETDEYHDYSIVNNKLSLWRIFCRRALVDSPESYYLFRILEDKIRKDPRMGKYDTKRYYTCLIKYSDQTSIHFLLDALNKYHVNKTGFFEDILPKVKLEDMEYIRQYGKETEMKADERDEFNRQLKLLEKKFGLTADGKPISKSME
jgi:hypothetical protein